MQSAIDLLKFENALLHSALDSSGVGICVLDWAQMIILVNERFARNLGKSEDELVGEPFSTVLKTLALGSPFGRLVETTGGDTALQTQITGRNGVRANYFVAARTIVHQQMTYRVLSVLDPLDVGTSVEKLSIVRRHIENLRTAVVIADALDDDLRVICANPQFFQTTGYAPAEILGQNLRILQGPETDPQAVARISSALAERRPVSVQLINYRKDGSKFTNDLTITPLLSASSKLVFFAATIRVVNPRFLQPDP